MTRNRHVDVGGGDVVAIRPIGERETADHDRLEAKVGERANPMMAATSSSFSVGSVIAAAVRTPSRRAGRSGCSATSSE
jgi:hypothetical protein